jgi:hypothetical protein
MSSSSSPDPQRLIPQGRQAADALHQAESAIGQLQYALGVLSAQFVAEYCALYSKTEGAARKVYADAIDYEAESLRKYEGFVKRMTDAGLDDSHAEGFSYNALDTILKLHKDGRVNAPEFVTTLRGTEPGTRNGTWTANAIQRMAPNEAAEQRADAIMAKLADKAAKAVAEDTGAKPASKTVEPTEQQTANERLADAITAVLTQEDPAARVQEAIVQVLTTMGVEDDPAAWTAVRELADERIGALAQSS